MVTVKKPHKVSLLDNSTYSLMINTANAFETIRVVAHAKTDGRTDEQINRLTGDGRACRNIYSNCDTRNYDSRFLPY